MSDQAHLLRVIDNACPGLPTEVEHLLYLPELCPATGNPKPGSTLRLRYQAGAKLLELFSLDAYLDAFIGNPKVRDMEYFVQTVARDAALALGQEVEAVAEVQFNRVRQGQKITVKAGPGHSGLS